MGDLEGKYVRGGYLFDRQYVWDSYDRMREKVLRMIGALNSMVPGRYESLYEDFDRIDRGIQETVFGRRDIPLSPLTIGFEEITAELAETVGGKSANLGEMRNRLGLPIPQGFAISAYAYRVFVEKTVLIKEMAKKLASVDIHDALALNGVSNEIRQAILTAPIPEELEEAVLRAYTALTLTEGADVSISVRSSAVGEDSEISFAGQYATALNVRPEAILTAYKEVLASKFTPESIFYWKEKGFSDEDIPMAVTCQTMIHARTSGVMYSQDPSDVDRNVVIISAVWGLGEEVAGQTSPNVYVVSRWNSAILETRVPTQETMLTCAKSGITDSPVPDDLKDRPCLSEKEILKLFEYALILEKHYQSPRDIEWVMDERGDIYLVQTRELQVSSGSAEKKEETAAGPYAEQALISWGLVASPGVGSGPVYLVSSDSDLDSVPRGSVLVVKSTHPKYVTVMDRTSAIIAEIGNVAGHMASLARESRVPTIVDAKDATKILQPGQLVTVDAYANRVYDGPVRELILKESRKEGLKPKKTAVRQQVERLLSRTVSLNLWDHNAESFVHGNCQTFHDLTRFMHEASIEEMFHLHDWKGMPDPEARQLVSDLSINLYFIDLGGGLSASKKARDGVRPDEIISKPMRALWRGITHPKVRWTGMVEVDLKGFASVMINTLSDAARYGTPLGEKSYAIVSQEYMNFSSRLAYHFSTVDAYCGETKNDNYISFQFMGGGSSSERRSRRARFIAEVLKHLDFEVETKGDWLRARLGKYESHDIEQKLDYLGRLMCCARQLDMAMYNDNVVDWYVESFMRGNYGFQKTAAEQRT